MRKQKFTFSMIQIIIVSLFLLSFTASYSQEVVHPQSVTTGVFHGLTPALKDIPAIKNLKKYEKNRADMKEKIKEYENGFERNPDMKRKNYSDAINALPGTPDPVWQKDAPANKANPTIVKNFAGQTSNSFPPDCNGAIGPNHFMQTINVTYNIYNKSTGAKVAGPTNMNTLFSGVTGSNCNDGDPIIIYDEFADRWLAAEFALCTSNNTMLVAVSTTNDPTGTWYKYSFDVDDTPDYMKFGVWNDGYYMSTNNGGLKDVYVFERSVMLTGGASPKMIGFSNAWRPNSGFHCIMPCDNDFTAASAGAPGMFITINDNAWGGTDALWIYELDADWTTTSNSTFTRIQTLSVPAFDSNFGSSWDNIAQYNSTQKLDAVNQILMFRAQYINFGSYQTIVCQHTVDVDATDHAGVRWYELRNNGSTWEIRQSGTYAPDAGHRWMGAISMNANHEIGLAYSYSNPSTNTYPSLKFTGQTSSENSLASGTFDVTETNIVTGTGAQTGANRWGDYSQMSVDPTDQNTFWFTSEYGKSGTKGTQIIGFYFNLTTNPPIANFSGAPTTMLPGTTVQFTDNSTNLPTSWIWDFPGGTPSSSTDQNPSIVYSTAGVYDATLIVVNGYGSDTITKTAYIEVIEQTPIIEFVGNPATITAGATVFYTDQTTFSPTSWLWDFPGGNPSSSTLQNPQVAYDAAGVYDVTLTASNTYGPDTLTKTAYITVNAPPATGGWIEQAAGFAEPSRGISGFSIVDANTAWAWAYDGVNTSNYIRDFTVTTNGGNLWTANSITGYDAYSIANICALSDLVAYAGMYPTGGAGGYVLKTTDGGVSWTPQTTATFNNSASFLNFVYFFDANNGVCMGDPIGSPKKFEVYNTTDGGDTWVLNTNSGLAMTISTGYGYVNDFCTVGDNIWFGTNTNKVYRSTDKGMTWANSSTALTETNLVSFADALNGFAWYTTTFAAKKTTNGGSTWTTYTAPTNMRKSDISRVPGLANTYVSVGAAQTDLGSSYTRNLGTAWDTIDASAQYTAVKFLDQNIGWAGGFNTDATTGGIYKWFGAPTLYCSANPIEITIGGSSSLLADVTGGWGNYVYSWTSNPAGFTSTEANPTVSPTDTTDYTIVVTSAFNEVSSTCTISVQPVGISELENSEINVYPNPANAELNIDIRKSNYNNLNVKIYNLVGEVIYSQNHNNKTSIKIDLSKYAAGVYYVALYSNAELMKKKITIIK
ncbi:MAG: hypothetical protein A2046_07995 [Bacteroidetes bacterium GWA2_30_7]|nr:MAG: hypothetical protein A2046_07995 [Bacteroidetes bacterium GWA2_30_7]